jgi:Family of unknown function (DUF6157)
MKNRVWDGSSMIGGSLEHKLLSEHPYKFTYEALILEVHRLRLGVSTAEFALRESEFRAELFVKPRACMRASSLPKRYGWGIHFDAEHRMAIYPLESAEYARLSEDKRVTQVSAMRSSRG